MERYRFIKKFDDYEGSIPEGSEITVLDNGAIYFNGGLVHAAYQTMLRKMIKNDKIRNEFLRQEAIPFNKV